MSENIMVTVMCTAFNHAEYIRDALDGMVNQQTSFKYEILVNDDCSTDGTADIVREYAEKYPEYCRQFDDDEQGGLRFEIDKGRFGFRLTAPYSDERRKKSSENAKQNGIHRR